MKPRSFDDATTWDKRKQTKEVPDDIRQALARMGKTAEGEMFCEFLLRAYIMNPSDPQLSDGALREYAATHRLARRIVILLQGDLNDSRDGTNVQPNRRQRWIDWCLRKLGRGSAE